MRSQLVCALCVAPFATLVACTPHVHTVHGNSPFQTGQPLGPFPNAWFEQPDSTTATKYRIVVLAEDLPLTSTGEALDATMFNGLDGYSPSTQIVVYFPQGVDSTQLTPTPTSPYNDRIELMLQSDSPIALIDVEAKQRVPFFAELDANYNPAVMGQRQGLLIHPMVRLRNGARYAVAIRTSLHDAHGNPFAPEGQFAQWVQGKLSPSDSLWEISDRLDADALAFSALGIARSDLALAWDFDTASDAATTGQLEKMVSQALIVAPKGLGYTIDSAQPDPMYFPNADKVVIGTFQSPSFEKGADPSPLNYDSNHVPIMGAPADWRFVAVIPKCVETAPGPVPLLMLGHGLFGSAWDELTNDDIHGLMQTLCMVALGANWVGLSGGPNTNPTHIPNEPNDFAILADVLTDPNQFDLITGRLNQGHVNFQVLTRLAMNALQNDAAFQVNGHPAYDPAQRYYWGASNGGIQGATYLSLSTDVNRGVLNVPGGDWSLLMWRSYDFLPALILLQATYPDPLDEQNVMALTQSLFDKTDPIEHAPHMIGTSKQVLFQESQNDAEVNNIATRTEMRTLQVKPLSPLLQPVYGLTAQEGPLSGLVYAQWSVDPNPIPPWADEPSPNNAAHDTMRWIPEVLEQTKQFLVPNGQVVNTCETTCEYPADAGTPTDAGQ